MENLHLSVIYDFLTYLNSKTDRYILKGGTALLFYGLDRFSEGIDLDGTSSRTLKSLVEGYCKGKGFSINIKRDTSSVFRCLIGYGGDRKLKVELSMRGFSSSVNRTTIRGVVIYPVGDLLRFKLVTLAGRYKLRGLYDVAFLWDRYRSIFSKEVLVSLVPLLVKNFPFSSLDMLIIGQGDYILPKTSIELMVARLLGMYENLNILET